MTRKIICEKCGSEDTNVNYRHKGELIANSARVKSKSEFHYSSQYDYYWKITAEKEHLDCHCRRCHFEWQEACGIEAQPESEENNGLG